MGASVSYSLEHSVELDDTDGYFVIGGGKFINGVQGYFGPLVYYRNRIPTHSTVCRFMFLLLFCSFFSYFKIILDYAEIPTVGSISTSFFSFFNYFFSYAASSLSLSSQSHNFMRKCFNSFQVLHFTLQTGQ